MSSKPTYTQGHDTVTTANHAARTAEVEGAFVLPHLKPSYKILDVGCGPGTISTGFAKHVPDGGVTGVDITQEVLDQAWFHVNQQSPKPSNISFEVGNVLEGLKFPDASFDVVFCNMVLVHTPEPVIALREMKRVCKPGGFVACREVDFPFRWYPYLPGLQLRNKYMYEQVIGRTDVPHPMNPPYQLDNHRGGSLVHVWAREVGFDPKKMKKGAGVEVHASEEQRKWWAGIFLGRMESGGSRERWKRLGATDEELEIMERDVKAWAEDVDGWYAQLNAEVICWV